MRQPTAREQQLNAPNLQNFGINLDWLHKKYHGGNRTNDSIALYRYLDVSKKKKFTQIPKSFDAIQVNPFFTGLIKKKT